MRACSCGHGRPHANRQDDWMCTLERYIYTGDEVREKETVTKLCFCVFVHYARNCMYCPATPAPSAARDDEDDQMLLTPAHWRSSCRPHRGVEASLPSCRCHCRRRCLCPLFLLVDRRPWPDSGWTGLFLSPYAAFLCAKGATLDCSRFHWLSGLSCSRSLPLRPLPPPSPVAAASVPPGPP